MHTQPLKSTAALLLGLSIVPAFAQSSVTLSGTLDLSVRQVKNGTLGLERSMASGSNATSKLVLRGRETLGGGWSAGFLLDATIAANAGTASTPFWDRQSTVDIRSEQYGEIRLGRDWAPTHLMWTTLDPFTTLGIASANSFRSTLTSRALGQAFGATAAASLQNPTLRVNNAVEYFLPSGLSGFYGTVMVSAAEGGDPGAGRTRGEGGRLGWTNKQWHLGYAVYNTLNAAGGQRFTDEVWGVTYDFGLAQLRVGQRTWEYRTDRTANTIIAATVPTSQGVVRLSYVKANQTGATAALNANDASLIGVGYVHNLSRRTALYGYVARISNDGASAVSIPGGPATSGLSTAANYFGGQKSSAFELGVRHNF
jgi:predicted porin